MKEKFYNWLKDGLYALLKEENSDNRELLKELDKIGGDKNDVPSIHTTSTKLSSKWK